jgi:hypothetical protein
MYTNSISPKSNIHHYAKKQMICMYQRSLELVARPRKNNMLLALRPYKS